MVWGRLFRASRVAIPAFALSILQIDPQEDPLLVNLREEDEDLVQKYGFFEHGLTYLQWTKEELVRNLWYHRYHSITNEQREQQQLSHKYWQEWYKTKVDEARLKEPEKVASITEQIRNGSENFIQKGEPFNIDPICTPWWKVQEILNIPTTNMLPILYGTKIVGKLMKDRADINILDIGCGTGIFGAYYTEYMVQKDKDQVINIMGIDGCEYVNTLDKKWGFLNDYYNMFMNFNICHPEFGNLEINHKFDVVISLELLYESAG